MNELYPIIRRVRRPLIVVDELKPANATQKTDATDVATVNANIETEKKDVADANQSNE